MNIYLDVETIPLPIEDRAHLRPSQADIKLGNLKDETKIKAKIDEATAAWERGDNCALDPLQARIAPMGQHPRAFVRGRVAGRRYQRLAEMSLPLRPDLGRAKAPHAKLRPS